MKLKKTHVLVFATFASVTKISKKNIIALYQVLCIYYLIHFKKNEIQALIDSGNKINIIILIYILNFNLKIRPINVRLQKIDSSTFKIFKIIIAYFQIRDKLVRA